MAIYAEFVYSDYFKTDLPSHWQEKRLGFLAMQTRNAFVDGPFGSDLKSDDYLDEGVPLIQLNNIRDGKHILRNMKFISDAKKNNLIRHLALPQDIVIAKMAEPVARAAIVSDEYDEYVIVADCVKLTPNLKVVDLDFLIWAINSDCVRENAELVSTGTTRIRINLGELKKLKVPYPPLSEQIQIRTFLDYETAKIDSLIEKQQQLIQLLKEKRQAVISHAVTKGLNPNVALKDSGVEWLGQVPEHWTVSKLKYFVNVVDCKHITAEFFDEGIPLASIGEVKGWKVNLLNAKLTNEKHYQELIDGNRTPQVGDIIYTRNATVGEASLVHSDLPKFALGQDVCLIHIIQKLLPEFLLHFLKSEIIKIQLNSAMVGSTFKRINVDDIRNYLIVIPPAEEQESILKDLSKKIEKYDLLIDFAVQQIKLMQERRTALISSAVTGKIDVSDWQNPNKNNEAKTEFSA